MDQINWISYLAVTVLFILTPGPEMALISGAAIQRGQYGAFLVILGVNCSSILWAVLAAVGFVGMATAIPLATEILTSVGALYLAYAGITSLRTELTLKRAQSSGCIVAVKETNFQIFARGFVLDITNPQVGLYYATVLPNFVRSGVDQGKYILIMGLIENALSFLWFMIFAAVLVQGANVLRAPRALSTITIITGGALTGCSGLTIYSLLSGLI